MVNGVAVLEYPPPYLLGLGLYHISRLLKLQR